MRIGDDTCLIIGIEDVLIGRLWSAIDEGRANDRKWATEMIHLFHERIDWQAVKRLAMSQGPRLTALVDELRHA